MPSAYTVLSQRSVRSHGQESNLEKEGREEQAGDKEYWSPRATVTEYRALAGFLVS